MLEELIQIVEERVNNESFWAYDLTDKIRFSVYEDDGLYDCVVRLLEDELYIEIENTVSHIVGDLAVQVGALIVADWIWGNLRE